MVSLLQYTVWVKIMLEVAYWHSAHLLYMHVAQFQEHVWTQLYTDNCWMYIPRCRQTYLLLVGDGDDGNGDRVSLSSDGRKPSSIDSRLLLFEFVTGSSTRNATAKQVSHGVLYKSTLTLHASTPTHTCTQASLSWCPCHKCVAEHNCFFENHKTHTRILQIYPLHTYCIRIYTHRCAKAHAQYRYMLQGFYGILQTIKRNLSYQGNIWIITW